ncbi:MAG: LemA family protein [Erysipelotrichaceae bacterium]
MDNWIFMGIILVLILMVVFVVTTYNGLIKMRNRIEEAFSTMDVYLKKRYDLIPNLIETVKGYTKHEKETLQAVIAARTQAVSSSSVEEQLSAEKGLNRALGRLFAVAESYPDLKANQNYLDLQKSLKDMEAEIANSRKYYNGVVVEFNTKIEMFPTNILASIFKFTKQTLYEISNEDERENVKVSF